MLGMEGEDEEGGSPTRTTSPRIPYADAILPESMEIAAQRLRVGAVGVVQNPPRGSGLGLRAPNMWVLAPPPFLSHTCCRSVSPAATTIATVAAAITAVVGTARHEYTIRQPRGKGRS
jgi:hypothetical protein